MAAVGEKLKLPLEVCPARAGSFRWSDAHNDNSAIESIWTNMSPENKSVAKDSSGEQTTGEQATAEQTTGEQATNGETWEDTEGSKPQVAVPLAVIAQIHW
ncbi:hypothetical protein Bbelb_278390 [Branchiostoma belcheri]|nr:hypothetical protein Bbelb_278390 [Branchiostoma belcheri]